MLPLPARRDTAPGRVLASSILPAPAPVQGSQVFSCKERELFLVCFHGRCTTAGCVMELPEDNSRVHWSKVTLQWHRSDLGRALSPRESPSKQPLRDAPLPSLCLSRSSQPAWVPGCPQTVGTDNSPGGYLGTAHLSSPAQIHRQIETVSREMNVCLGFADVSLKVLYQSLRLPL